MTIFKNACAAPALTAVMNKLDDLFRMAICTALGLTLLAGCVGNAVRLGSDNEPTHTQTYERFTLAQETTLTLSEPPRVDPRVARRAIAIGPLSVSKSNKIVRLPDAQFATVRLSAPISGGVKVHVELLDDTGQELASTDYEIAEIHVGLQSSARLFAGYDHGLWVAVVANANSRFTRFDNELNTASEVPLLGASVQGVYEPTDSFLGIRADPPLTGIYALPTDSDCRRLSEDPTSASRMRSRIWTSDALWMTGCSSPPKGLPTALSKPAIYQCAADGTLLRAVELDLLSNTNACLSNATWQGDSLVGLVDLGEPTIVRVDMVKGTFDAQHLHKQSPPLTEASIDVGNGTVVLNPRLSVGSPALGPNGELLLVASDSEAGADILCLVASFNSIRCVRPSSAFDSVFSSIALSGSLRAFVFSQQGDLWGVDFPPETP